MGSDKFTSESQEAITPPTPPSRRPQSTHKQTRTKTQHTLIRKKRSTKVAPLGKVSKLLHRRAQTGPTAPTPPPTQMRIKTHRYMVCMKDLPMHHQKITIHQTNKPAKQQQKADQLIKNKHDYCQQYKSDLEVIKLEFILRLKIKRSDWLLADTCPQTANHCALF